MAYIFKVATKIKRFPPLLLPLILRTTLSPPPPPPPTSSSSSVLLISPFSITSTANIQRNPSFSLDTYPNSYHYETSDFEADESKTTYLDQHGLHHFLQLLHQTHQFSSRGDAIAFLQKYGSHPTKNLVYAAMWELRNEWKLAFLALEWGEREVSNRASSWNLMVWILGKQKKFDLAWKLVREMHRLGMGVRTALLIMMKRYAAANEAYKAIRAFHAMEKFRIPTDSAAFYTLLRALCKHKNIEEAEELMFLNRGLFTLETESFNIILNGWCNILVDVIEAKRIWREMSSCCIHPDGVSYTHMISCFSKVGNLFDSLRLFDEMKKKGWVPDMVVYNSLIFILTKENCLGEAHKLLNKIVQEGLRPNAETCNSFIYPLCETNKLEEARNMLNEMIEKGANPTIGTYHAFVEVENMEGTLKLINQMQQVGCGPNGSTFLLIFNKFFRWGLPGDVLRMWIEMGKRNVIPEVEHFVVLVEGLAKCGWLNKAREIYSEMKARGFSDDPMLEKILRPVASNRNIKGRGRHIKED